MAMIHICIWKFNTYINIYGTHHWHKYFHKYIHVQFSHPVDSALCTNYCNHVLHTVVHVLHDNLQCTRDNSFCSSYCCVCNIHMQLCFDQVTDSTKFIYKSDTRSPTVVS